MSIYEGTQTEQDYRAGLDDGARWAEADADEGSRSGWLETFAGEVETFRHTRTATSPRAYYLGVLRGYREVVRTQDTKGRWGT